MENILPDKIMLELKSKEEKLVRRVQLVLYEADSFNAERFCNAWNNMLQLWRDKKQLVLKNLPYKTIKEERP